MKLLSILCISVLLTFVGMIAKIKHYGIVGDIALLISTILFFVVVIMFLIKHFKKKAD